MQQTDELFSALLDGELASEDIDALIETLDHEPASAGAVTRWSSIGVMMRGQSRLSARTDLLEGVREAIATEAADHQNPKVSAIASRRPTRRWTLPVTGLAAAASIAVAAVVLPVVWQGTPSTGTAEELPSISGSGAFANAPSLQSSVAQARPDSSAAGARSASREGMNALPVGDERLNTYYIEYAGHRSAQGIGGPLGYARYAAHNADLNQRTR